MKYTITHSGVAALITVKPENCEASNYIYMSEENGIVDNKGLKRGFESLPSEIKDVLTREFKKVFKLPLRERGKYLDNLAQLTLEIKGMAEDGPANEPS